MNINEFAEYLTIRDTDKASELYNKLYFEILEDAAKKPE